MDSTATAGGRIYSNRDPAAWRKRLATLSRPAEYYGLAVEGLRDKFVEDFRLAENALRPAEKVEHLEMAKWRLGMLVERVAEVPGLFHIEGLDDTTAAIRELEATFRAFGYYRMAGVA